MLIELAVVAAMVQQDYGACGVIDSSWQITECVEVPGPRIHFGETSIGNVVLQDKDFTTPDAPAGQIGIELGPAPSAGYYQYGVIPVCERDGAVTVAGGGGVGFQPSTDGSTGIFGYHAIKNSDPGYLIGYSGDACVSPGRRGVVVVGGYSETEVLPEGAQVGWSDGDNSILGWRFVATTPVYGVAGTPSVVIYQEACWGAYEGNVTASECYQDNLAGKSVNVRFYRTDGTFGLLGEGAGSWYSGNSSGGVFINESSSAQSTGAKFFSYLTVEIDGEIVTYYPPGHPLFEEASDHYSGQAMVVFPPGLDKIIYNPHAPDFDWLDGQCDTMDCVTSYCDGFGLDIVGWLGCFVGFDVNVLDWFQSLWDNMQHGAVWNAVTYSFELVQSYPRALSGLDGACGELFDIDSGPLKGLEGSTCAWPYKSEVRSIAAGFVYFLAALTVIRLITKLMIEGNPGYFGFGTRGETQGTLW